MSLLFLLPICGQETRFSPKKSIAAKPGQFRVDGGDTQTGGAFVLLAEEAKREILQLSEATDAWQIPVRISLYRSRGPIITKLLDIDGLKTFILRVYTGDGVREERFRKAIYTLVIYELALRGRELPDSAMRVMPWLPEGILEAVEWSKGQRDRNLYRGVFEGGGVYRLDELFETTEAEYEKLDTASKAAFRVCSGVLVMALLEQPNGKEGVRNFLREISHFEGEMSVLMSRHFPGMNLSNNGLEKLWSLQMANKGGLNTLTDVLDIQTSERLLEQALTFPIRDSEGIEKRRPLSEWQLVLNLPASERGTALGSTEGALVRMSYRCFPPYREILSEYQQVLLELADGKTIEIEKTLAELKDARRHLLERAEQAKDYLDWFEITRAEQSSGEFRDFIGLKKLMKEEGGRRSSTTSRYLDQMNDLFTR